MPNSPARILVVDDEKLIRWSVSERLQRDGYVVATAETGEQAIEAIAADPPDLVLLDVQLPGMNGVETLQKALGLQPEISVIMMSAHSTVDTAVDAMKHGALDFLVKPFPLQLLDAAVERALSSARTRRQIATLTLQRGRGEVVARLSIAQQRQGRDIQQLAGGILSAAGV